MVIMPNRGESQPEVSTVASRQFPGSGQGRRRYFVTGLVCITVIAGLSQNIVDTYLPLPFITYVDDVFLLITLIAVFPRMSRAPGHTAVLIILWFTVMLFAAYRTVLTGLISNEDMFTLLRQVLMPVVAVAIGLVLERYEWEFIFRFSVLVAAINAAYIGLEVLGIRLVDPGIIAARRGLYLFPGGVPGHYLVFGESSTFIRAGGLYLNPPTTGILTAFGAVVALNLRRSNWGIWVAITLSIATFLTVSRAGILILAAGLALPWLVRRVGPLVSYLVLGTVALFVAIDLASVEGTGIHLDGLTSGLLDAWKSVIGRGFGYAGNFTRHLESMESAESLVGIAFSAAGLAAVAIFAFLVIGLLARLQDVNEKWIPGLGLGIATAALFAETAGSINATVPLWICLGVSLGTHLRRSLPEKDAGVRRQANRSGY